MNPGPDVPQAGSPMRVLMISDVYFPRVNGVSTSIQVFRADLNELGLASRLVAPLYPGQRVDAGTDVIRLPSLQVPRDPEDRCMRPAALGALRRELRPGDFDVVHIQTPFIAHYAGLAMARALSVPVVESYHTYFEHYLQHYVPAVPARLTRLLARRFTVSQCEAVNAVIAPSTQMADALRRYGVATPIEIIPTGMPASSFVPGDGARFRALHGIPATRPVAAFVGRVAHEKNIDFLISMLPYLRAAMPDVLLVIAGEGPARGHCERRVAAAGLAGSVRFVGYLDRATELPDCYRAADVFVFASRTETQGLVLLEAMAQGTPVVSTAVMGTIDVLAGTQGSVVVPEDEKAFAAAVARVLGDSARRAELGRRALADAQRWSSRALAAKLVTVYERIREEFGVNKDSRSGHRIVPVDA
jgi:1,2-diacylglycerol 3-alpha-glucosyltransferase